MSYTGIKDSRGQKLFVGDIIQDDKHVYIIDELDDFYIAIVIPAKVIIFDLESLRNIRKIGSEKLTPELLEGS